jgi:hypothetical protein
MGGGDRRCMNVGVGQEPLRPGTVNLTAPPVRNLEREASQALVRAWYRSLLSGLTGPMRGATQLELLVQDHVEQTCHRHRPLQATPAFPQPRPPTCQRLLAALGAVKLTTRTDRRTAISVLGCDRAQRQPKPRGEGSPHFHPQTLVAFAHHDDFDGFVDGARAAADGEVVKIEWTAGR